MPQTLESIRFLIPRYGPCTRFTSCSTSSMQTFRLHQVTMDLIFQRVAVAITISCIMLTWIATMALRLSRSTGCLDHLAMEPNSKKDKQIKLVTRIGLRCMHSTHNRSSIASMSSKTMSRMYMIRQSASLLSPLITRHNSYRY